MNDNLYNENRHQIFQTEQPIPVCTGNPTFHVRPTTLTLPIGRILDHTKKIPKQESSQVFDKFFLNFTSLSFGVAPFGSPFLASGDGLVPVFFFGLFPCVLSTDLLCFEGVFFCSAKI
jgi:hypothetical protein